MGKHLAVRKKLTVFDLRYYQRRVIALWIKVRRQVKARLNHG
jgi:hypothetical protein